MILFSLVYDQLNKNRCVFVTSDGAFHVYRGSKSSFHGVCQVSTVAKNRQTKHWQLRGPFFILSGHCKRKVI